MACEVGCIYIVPTPIGNLGDITLRALEVLRSCDVVYAEDTRVTGRLLAAYDISKPLERLDENTIAARGADVVARAEAGQRCAFCTDAGMPGISDPAARLIGDARAAGVCVEVLPGASAAALAYVQAAHVQPAFYFGGFLPRKRAQIESLLRGLARLDATLVFYESPHRASASADAIAHVLPNRQVTLCRELTKLHEEVLTLPAPKLARELAARDKIKGEVALVISPPAKQASNTQGGEGGEGVDVCAVGDLDAQPYPSPSPSPKDAAGALVLAGYSAKDASRAIATIFGVPKREAYKWAIGEE